MSAPAAAREELPAVLVGHVHVEQHEADARAFRAVEELLRAGAVRETDRRHARAFERAHHDRPVVAISPVGYAVLKLREAVIDGKAPGVKKQSDLYRDLLGHGQPPILALCTYVNYATIYGRSPVGLKPFDTFNGTVSPELHRLLQEIAWETVSKYKPSGVVVDGE